ncbi:helix-turn-helix transcriptional regulator [Dactylosporangium sp. NPDC051485]|uniref:helix-turn-helix domain-containing protein n=1 Tax=Dactylosporangium sp. NPDC051485 TaxID=3154846 RepID=UPI003420C32E
MAFGGVASDSRLTADVPSFGNQLRQARCRQQWSQRELGAATYFSREYVAMVERGLRNPSATFVERAGAALGANRELVAAFGQMQQTRRPATREGAEGPRVRRRSRITVAAGRLRAVGASLQTLPSWSAFDELHHVLREEIDPVDAATEVAELEQRCADLVEDGHADRPWADVASWAALGLADAGALLQRPLCAGHIRRLKTVARRFAVLSADALLMLGEAERAGQWLRLVDAIERRDAEAQLPAMPEGSSETALSAPSGIDAPSRSRSRVPAGAPCSTRWMTRPSTRDGRRTCGDLRVGVGRTAQRRVRPGRAPPR